MKLREKEDLEKLRWLRNNKKEMTRVLSISYKLVRAICPKCRGKLLLYTKRLQKTMPIDDYCLKCRGKADNIMKGADE